MFDKPSMHSAVKKLQAVIKPQGITLTEASLRWLVYHSALREGDGVTLGASKMSHLEDNTKDIAKGPLPDDVVEGWRRCGRLARRMHPRLRHTALTRASLLRRAEYSRTVKWLASLLAMWLLHGFLSRALSKSKLPSYMMQLHALL
jgi:hypothetical protein